MWKVLGRDENQPVTDIEHMKAMEVLLKDQENEIDGMKKERVEVVKKYQNKIKGLHAKIKSLTDLLAGLHSKIDDLETKLSTAVSQHIIAKREKEETEKLIEDIPNMSDQQKAKTIRSLRSTNRNLTKNLTAAETKASAAVVQKAKNEMTLCEHRNEISRLKGLLTKKIEQVEKMSSTMEKMQKQIDAMTKKIKNYDEKKLESQVEVQQSKERQTEQVAINIETKKNSEKELISHRNNEKIRLKNHDQLLKAQEKAEKKKERTNRFRLVGERMGGTGVEAMENTGHFDRMNAPIALNHPHVKNAMTSYVQTKTTQLINSIIAKRASYAAQQLDDLEERAAAATPVTPSTPKKRKNRASGTKTKKKNRPTDIVDALEACPPGWSCIETKKGFAYKNKTSGEVTFDPPSVVDSESESESEPEPVLDFAARSPTVAVARTTTYDSGNYNDDDSSDDSKKKDSVVGQKTTGMDDDADTSGSNENDNHDDDDGSSNAHRPADDDNDDNKNSDDNFGLSQSFVVPPGLFGFTRGASDNFNEDDGDDNN